MVDGRQNYETKEVLNFAGLNASVDQTKDGFGDFESPYIINHYNKDGILAVRCGRLRLNTLRYANEITSLCSYKDRSNVTHLVYAVKSAAAITDPPDGTISESH